MHDLPAPPPAPRLTWRPVRAEDPVPDPGTPPRGTRIVPWAPDLDASAVLASNAAFALHWDSLPMSLDDWRTRHTDDDIFRPDRSFPAVERARVVAVCICSVDHEQTERTGVREPRVNRLGTVPDRQRRGLGIALLLHSMRAGADAGLAQAGLAVDAAGNTNATVLYERVGFSIGRRSLTYIKDFS